jgi:hypothetical protein
MDPVTASQQFAYIAKPVFERTHLIHEAKTVCSSETLESAHKTAVRKLAGHNFELRLSEVAAAAAV